MEDRLRAVLRLDDDVSFLEPALDVAALAFALGDERSLTDSLVRVEQRLERFPVDVDELDGRLGLREGVGCDGRDRLSVVVGFLGQRPERASDARGLAGGKLPRIGDPN